MRADLERDPVRVAQAHKWSPSHLGLDRSVHWMRIDDRDRVTVRTGRRKLIPVA